MSNVLKLTGRSSRRLSFFICVVTLLSPAAPASATNRVTVRRVSHNGWPDSLVIGNGTVEAVVVPAAGRVMQFRFIGEEGVFWENSALGGKSPDAQASEWGNFGGDKTWPAPQADWPEVTDRKWPRPWLSIRCRLNRSSATTRSN